MKRDSVVVAVRIPAAVAIAAILGVVAILVPPPVAIELAKALAKFAHLV